MEPIKSTAEVLEIAKQERVRFLRLQFTDILGAIKNVEVPEHQFERARSAGSSVWRNRT
jgi:glutamine synthetase